MSALFGWLGGLTVALAVAAGVALWVFGRLLPRWLPVALVAVLALSFAGQGMALRAQLAGAKAAHAKDKADWAAAQAEANKQALEAQRDVARREQDLQRTIDQQERQARDAQQHHDRRVAAARADADRLREQLARIASRYGGGDAAGATAAAAAGGAPASDAIGVLANVLGRADERAAELARIADEARAAGLMCERAYDAARMALQEGAL